MAVWVILIHMLNCFFSFVNDQSVNAMSFGFNQVQKNQTNARELLFFCPVTMSLIVTDVKAAWACRLRWLDNIVKTKENFSSGAQVPQKAVFLYDHVMANLHHNKFCEPDWSPPEDFIVQGSTERLEGWTTGGRGRNIMVFLSEIKSQESVNAVAAAVRWLKCAKSPLDSPAYCCISREEPGSLWCKLQVCLPGRSHHPNWWCPPGTNGPHSHTPTGRRCHPEVPRTR